MSQRTRGGVGSLVAPTADGTHLGISGSGFGERGIDEQSRGNGGPVGVSGGDRLVGRLPCVAQSSADVDRGLVVRTALGGSCRTAGSAANTLATRSRAGE